MLAVYHPDQEAHRPLTRLVYGVLKDNFETPERATLLLDALHAERSPIVEPNDYGRDPLLRIHSSDYLAFIEHCHREWQAIPGAGPEVRPSLHPNRYMDRRPDDLLGRAGYYMADAGCVVLDGTWKAAYAAAQTAIHAATLVAGGARAAYALCRPPGHHAYRDMAGGFCYLNNAAIAAGVLRESFGRVAIVDVDVHHGNGTQEIFYARPDIAFASVHADPLTTYPYYAGYADETGSGAGAGLTLNVPLPPGSGDSAWLDAVGRCMRFVTGTGAEALVISLGLDASANDPFRCMQVSHRGFAAIGQRLAAAGLPTVIVQEGGYVSPSLPVDLVHFLRGFGTV
ncbi:histone deacetylase family protein [Burkholderia aenigmatica]|uniref:Acetylpolyamine amidohydrolase n=1 Tax=Burkholderia aenigmatica TaxID=2015348 RepID=A0A228HTA6_9BURK|nr:histone deacetylase family protein [Burkholderia aenigmatica]OXI33368.1 acetylpolyamine amidohydrolase [Burkholderia aenigmatica]